MARWIELGALQLSRVTKSGYERFEIEYGEQIPDEIATPNWIGSNFGSIDQLSETQKGFYAQWKRDNPLQARRWQYLELSKGIAKRQELSLEADAASLAGGSV